MLTDVHLNQSPSSLTKTRNPTIGKLNLACLCSVPPMDDDFEKANENIHVSILWSLLQYSGKVWHQVLFGKYVI